MHGEAQLEMCSPDGLCYGKELLSAQSRGSCSPGFRRSGSTSVEISVQGLYPARAWWESTADCL